MNFAGTLRVNKFACFVLAFLLFLMIYWRYGGTSYPTEKGDVVNLKSLLKAAIQAAERGGKKVVEGKDRDLNVKSKGKTDEGANDPVTDADYASHCAIYYGLKNKFSKLRIVSEEYSKEDDASCKLQPEIDVDAELPEHPVIERMNDEHVYAKDVTIWIDPLDATQEYTEALYQYVTTMVCVAIRGVPIIGVIHFPFTPQTYWGWYTKRASSNMPLAPRNADHREHTRVVVSRSHPGQIIEYTKDAFGPESTVMTAAGAGYKVMEVVNGTADVYIHITGIKKWDLCAGDAIIKSVDGKMTTSAGNPIDFSPHSARRVVEGVVVSMYDHDFYLNKVPQIVG